MKGRKILIITHPLHTNYGGILQAYALQKIIADKGYYVCTELRWSKKTNISILFISWLFRLFMRYIVQNKKYQAIFPYSISAQDYSVISKNTRSFIYKYVKTVEIFQKNNLCSNNDSVDDFDTIIVGSDQVWRPFLGYIEPKYMLAFAKRKSINRIAYAASFGIGEKELKLRCVKQYKKLAKLFDAISVRELSGVSICNKLFDTKATHLLDPTMLLEVDVYKSLVLENKEPASDGDIMCYILDKTKEKEDIIDKISSSLNLKPFSCQAKSNLDWSTRSKIEECVQPSVTSWLKGFIDAKFVVTDSFHGCVFSIIFNKPFIVMMNKERGGDRFLSLLSMFELESRLIYSINDLNQNKINSAIEWNKVNNNISIQKEKSITFLFDAINKTNAT